MSPPRRILVCPQEFKGTLDAIAAADVIAAVARRLLPDAEVQVQPMADGGPGTADVIARSAPSHAVETTVADAYGQPVSARYVRLEDSPTAVIEAAAAAGLAATPPERRAPLASTSRGVGALIAHAVEGGASRVVLGVGGTASSDGGAGAARALGLELMDAAGHPLPEGAIHLARLARVEDRVPPILREARVRIAVDVRNPLTGPRGAVAIYGSQKGLGDWEAPALDGAIRRWAEAVRHDLGREVETIGGAGAGGGIPAGILAALPGATIESGAELVADTVGLRELIAAADLVITGEGALDAQTAYGKSVARVAELAAAAGVPCIAVAGTVQAVPAGIADAEPVARTAAELPAALATPHPYLEAAAERLLLRWAAREA